MHDLFNRVKRDWPLNLFIAVLFFILGWALQGHLPVIKWG